MTAEICCKECGRTMRWCECTEEEPKEQFLSDQPQEIQDILQDKHFERQRSVPWLSYV